MIHRAKLTLVEAIAALAIAWPGVMAHGTAAAVAGPSYPWCAQGDHYRCWYMTHEQCKEAVDYHGFCVTRPNVGGE
ncbi:MAG TPA: DUF3551 domain-containing protein [Xanthobacteraceae bacterium]